MKGNIRIVKLLGGCVAVYGVTLLPKRRISNKLTRKEKQTMCTECQHSETKHQVEGYRIQGCIEQLRYVAGDGPIMCPCDATLNQK